MKLNVYSVFDSKAAVYGTPFFQVNDMVAMRSFSQLANDSNSSVNRFPEDYTLYLIGYYDDSVGEVKGCEPKPLLNGAAVLKPKELAV